MVEQIEGFLVDSEGGGLEPFGWDWAGLTPLKANGAFGGLEVQGDARQRGVLDRGRDGPERGGEQEEKCGSENGPPVLGLYLFRFGRRSPFWDFGRFGAEREGSGGGIVTGPDESAGAGDGDGGDGDVEAGSVGVFGEAAVDGPLPDGIGVDYLRNTGDFRAIGT